MAAASQAALFVLLIAAPPFFNSYWIGLLTQVLIFAILAMSLDILLGCTGLRRSATRGCSASRPIPWTTLFDIISGELAATKGVCDCSMRM
jgi:hypothetical protein